MYSYKWHKHSFYKQCIQPHPNTITQPHPATSTHAPMNINSAPAKKHKNQKQRHGTSQKYEWIEFCTWGHKLFVYVCVIGLGIFELCIKLFFQKFKNTKNILKVCLHLVSWLIFWKSLKHESQKEKHFWKHHKMLYRLCKQSLIWKYKNTVIIIKNVYLFFNDAKEKLKLKLKLKMKNLSIFISLKYLKHRTDQKTS